MKSLYRKQSIVFCVFLGSMNLTLTRGRTPSTACRISLLLVHLTTYQMYKKAPRFFLQLGVKKLNIYTFSNFKHAVSLMMV